MKIFKKVLSFSLLIIMLIIPFTLVACDKEKSDRASITFPEAYVHYEDSNRINSESFNDNYTFIALNVDALAKEQQINFSATEFYVKTPLKKFPVAGFSVFDYETGMWNKENSITLNSNRTEDYNESDEYKAGLFYRYIDQIQLLIEDIDGEYALSEYDIFTIYYKNQPILEVNK